MEIWKKMWVGDIFWTQCNECIHKNTTLIQIHWIRILHDTSDPNRIQ